MDDYFGRYKYGYKVENVAPILTNSELYRDYEPIEDMNEFEILVGDRAVWINDSFGCLGRFGVMGIDVHRKLDDQHLGQCLDCTHAKVNPQDWTRFQSSMMTHHGVDLSHVEMPDFARAILGHQTTTVLPTTTTCLS